MELQPYKDLYSERYSSGDKSEEAVILFHGYPSPDSKNEYIAEYIANKFNKDVFLFHYKGLGKSTGYFSFPESVKDSYEYYKMVSNLGYKRITLLGHSWGGLIVLNLIADLKPTDVDNIVLLSPYNYFPDGQDLKNLINLVYNDSKDDFKQSLETMESQIDEVLNDFQPRKKLNEIRNFNGNITILQAKNDDEVPSTVTKQFYELIKSTKVAYIEVDTDHSFTINRCDSLAFIGKAIDQ